MSAIVLIELMESRLDDDSSSSSDEDEMIINAINSISQRKRCRIHHYVSGVVPHYSHMEFRAHFRLHKATFDNLLGNYDRLYFSRRKFLEYMKL